MTPNSRRRALLLLAAFSPAAHANVSPGISEGPVDLIRRLFDEVLASPRRRAYGLFVGRLPMQEFGKATPELSEPRLAIAAFEPSNHIAA
jgi:hypothetical protein